MSTELLTILKNAQEHRRKSKIRPPGEPRQSGLRFRAGETIRCDLHPVCKVIDEKAGIVEYVASDETLDCYKEVVRADGWKFDHFKKNAPFVDSHDYSTISKLLGNVVDYKITGRQLVETVKWAIDVADCPLARMGFNLTRGGYLKAVSVGFTPTRYVTKWDSDRKPWLDALRDLNMHEEDGIQVIYLEQQQKELSACILGANPNALARAYKAEVLSDADIDLISQQRSQRATATTAEDSAVAVVARQRTRKRFLEEIEKAIKRK